MSRKTMTILNDCIPTFNMLQDKNRQEILLILFEHKELTVNEVVDKMVLSRPTVSHHLKLLLQANLVSVKQIGKERYYKVEFATSLNLLKNLILSLEEDIEYLKLQ